ncbi:probable glucosamine 6-phosphate N-acetyltransferase [Melanaphis sacchari]|uniref:Glucosamine 6-phosphate N-acetyltransferase n=1 Tax=Melanaphis sacchari TaxID=742174 RepID=A0A2H8TX86_9HEMI|nr:probable glucosamine 6-phosphate N-acetyltransferase [Melanaphis sacchari]XP_025205849.1 probable glucosamine 6-phosphate N-acetyltransferase [Melanaphis sacchari]
MAVDYLFDPRTLAAATAADDATGDNRLSVDDVGCKYRLRPLCLTDFGRGYLDLLSELTVTGNVTQQMYSNTFDMMKKNSGTYYIIVVEDTEENCIVASGSLTIEKKFIHSCGQRGRIEDIVVNSKCRGQRFGKIVVQRLIALSRVLNCYKISLECKDSYVNWYSSMGFVKEPGNSNYMQLRFEQPLH